MRRIGCARFTIVAQKCYVLRHDLVTCKIQSLTPSSAPSSAWTPALAPAAGTAAGILGRLCLGRMYWTRRPRFQTVAARQGETRQNTGQIGDRGIEEETEALTYFNPKMRDRWPELTR